MLRLLFGYVRLVLRDKLRMLVKDESGVTAIEYGLIAAAIALAIAGVVVFLGQDIANLFQTTRDQLQPSATGLPP